MKSNNTKDRCNYSFTDETGKFYGCSKKCACPICGQCGDGGRDGHCPGHSGVKAEFLKKAVK